MSLALISAKQVLSILVIMLGGVIAKKTGILDKESNKHVSELMLNIVNPVVIFVSYQRAYEARLAHNLLITFLLSFAAMGIAIAIVAVMFRKDPNDRRYLTDRFAGAAGNAGFFGIPLVGGVFGAEGVFYLTAYITAFNLLAWTVGISNMSGKFTLKTLKEGLLSPSMFGILAGMVCFFTGLILPDAIAAPFNYIADLNTGLAMLVAGVSVAATDFRTLKQNLRVIPVILCRLVICPVLVGLLLKLVPVDPIVRGVVLIATACPAATMTIMFTYRYGGDDIYATLLFTVTTVLCAVSIPLVMLLA